MSGEQPAKLKTAHIGRCGELLVQYSLLLRGIDSAAMSTDAGVDLVTYSPFTAQPLTIQVKTVLRPKPSGGRGKAGLDWWVDEGTPAQFVALVELLTERIWFFAREELALVAQQRSSGQLHFYMFDDEVPKPRNPQRLTHTRDFDRYLLKRRVVEIFGQESSIKPHALDPSTDTPEPRDLSPPNK